MATTQPVGCPSLCQHGNEPAGRHHGVIQLGSDVSGLDFHLTRLPGEDGAPAWCSCRSASPTPPTTAWGSAWTPS